MPKLPVNEATNKWESFMIGWKSKTRLFSATGVEDGREDVEKDVEKVTGINTRVPMVVEVERKSPTDGCQACRRVDGERRERNKI